MRNRPIADRGQPITDQYQRSPVDSAHGPMGVSATTIAADAGLFTSGGADSGSGGDPIDFDRAPIETVAAPIVTDRGLFTSGGPLIEPGGAPTGFG